MKRQNPTLGKGSKSGLKSASASMGGGQTTQPIKPGKTDKPNITPDPVNKGAQDNARKDYKSKTKGAGQIEGPGNSSQRGGGQRTQPIGRDTSDRRSGGSQTDRRPTQRGENGGVNKGPKQSAHDRIREARKGIGSEVPSPHRPKVQGYLDRLHGMRESQRNELFGPKGRRPRQTVERPREDSEEQTTPSPGFSNDPNAGIGRRNIYSWGGGGSGSGGDFNNPGRRLRRK